MMRYIFICIMITAFIAVAIAGDKTKVPDKPPLIPSEFVWLFGIIPPNVTVSHHYALTNPHEDTVTIVDIDADCDCTTVPKTPIAIPPGETYLLKAEFDTRTYYGETNRNIVITTDYDPVPKLIVYFSSIASQMPKSLRISPSMTAFIPGKDSQAFTITNLTRQKTTFTVLIDHDSTLKVSETTFDIDGGQSREITIAPIWDRIAPGYTHSCVVLEFTRENAYQVSIPIKLNKF